METVNNLPETGLSEVRTFHLEMKRNKGGLVPTWIILPGVSVAAMLVLLVGGYIGEVVMRTQTPATVPVDTSYPKMGSDLKDRVTNALNPQNQQAEPLGDLSSNFEDKTTRGSQPDLNQPGTGGFAPSPVVGQLLTKEVKKNAVNPFGAGGVLPVPINSGGQTTAGGNAPVIAATSDVVDRYNERNGQLRRGAAVEPVAQIYDIEDVTPIGVVGDTKRRDVMFYSPKTKQTFAVPLGTRFRNGVLQDASGSGNTVDGVRFRRDGSEVAETRAWGKSKEDKKSDSSDQPLIANESVLNPTISKKEKN